jgi:hypothetical protein
MVLFNNFSKRTTARIIATHCSISLVPIRLWYISWESSGFFTQLFKNPELSHETYHKRMGTRLL